MSYNWQEHDGLISVLVDGQLPDPFMYIIAENPPPWRVQNVDGTMHDFDSEEAAKLALLLKLK